MHEEAHGVNMGDVDDVRAWGVRRVGVGVCVLIPTCSFDDTFLQLSLVTVLGMLKGFFDARMFMSQG